jgi:PHD/YefM family antitoxin component YafN of YafNO toxin-antitoxin module
MQTYTAHDAQLHFDELLDCAQREPVRVVQGDRVLGVMVSAEDYDAMLTFHANRSSGSEVLSPVQKPL